MVFFKSSQAIIISSQGHSRIQQTLGLLGSNCALMDKGFGLGGDPRTGCQERNQHEQGLGEGTMDDGFLESVGIPGLILMASHFTLGPLLCG